MRFLIEKSVLSDDQALNFQSMSREKKSKFVDKYLNNHPNKNNLKYSFDVCKESILENGFDTSKNKFLLFINKTKYPLQRETANVLSYFINRNDLDVSSRWLYRKDLFEGSDEDIAFKIKAMVYASNNSYQKNANKKITPQDLLNKNGKIMEVGKIKKLLNNITVTQSDTEKDTSDVSIGADVLKQKLNVAKLDYNMVREYAKGLLSKSNMSTIQKGMIDEGDLDDDFEEILAKKFSSVMGRDLSVMLDKKFVDAITTATNKSLEGKK